MKLKEYKKSVKSALRQATLVYLVKDDEILLAMTKRGFSEGKWNGAGGKVDKNESVEEAAIRETEEEIGVTPKSLRHVATLDFYFAIVPIEKNWNQQVLVFFADDWDGEPTESEEMAPKWYKTTELPFDSMWTSDLHWLPKVLNNKFVTAEFLFGENNAVLDSNIQAK